MRQRFTFISLSVGWKRGAILRRLAKTKTRKKAEKNAILRNAERRALGFAGAVSAIDAAEAGAGAVEAVRNAVVPSTPGTEAWWQAAVREAVYAPLEGPAQYVRETVNWTGLLKKGLDGLQLLQRLDLRQSQP